QLQTRIDKKLAGEPVNLWQCDEELRALAQPSVLSTAVNSFLERLLKDETYSPELPTEWKMCFCKGQDFHGEVVVLEPYYSSHNFLSTTVDKRSMIVAKGGPLIMETFAEPSQPDDVFDPARKLIPQSPVTLTPGKIHHLQAGRDVYRLLIPKETTILVVLVSKTFLKFRWDYDLASLCAIRLSSASLGTSRLQFAVRAAGYLGGADSIPHLRKLLQHPQHFVRWEAVRSAYAIDPEEGARMLLDCQDDRHPHVRKAAMALLQTQRSKQTINNQ